MGKRREEDQTVHLRLSPLKSVHTLVSVFHTLAPTPRAIFIQCNVHCRQWTHHNGHDALTGTEPCKAQTSHLSLLSAQGKSQHHLCFSGSEALLFISVHLGHSLSEPIVLFFSFFFFCCLFVSYKGSFLCVPLQLQMRQCHPVFHQHNIWPKLVCALFHCSQNAEKPLVQGIQMRVRKHW